jgi:hypothetical protein
LKCDPQTRRANCDYGESVKIKHGHSAQKREYERIPAQRGQKISVEELDSRSRHAARDARQTSELVKYATRPWQTERKPKHCDTERSERNAQPKQLVIDFMRREAMAA